jgi:hypothetical protein
MGALYISAEFSDGNTYHYWLRNATVWAADTDYQVNETVAPSVDNGFVYKARRLAGANPAWSEGTPRATSDVVEPTTANNFKYTVTQVVGPTPRSGDIEPLWPTIPGAIIIEDIDDPGAPEVVPPPTPTIDDDRFLDECEVARYKFRRVECK